MKSKSLEQWREYFESGNCSIYQIIFNAIRVAALDDPQEFKLRRKRIAERLYSCQFTGSCCCVDQTEQDVHSTITQVFQECKKACARKGAKVHDSTVIAGGKATDQANNELENNVEVERENIRCVLQIKDELENKELTDTEIYESLTKLQLMVRSVGVMEATKIGSTITNLKRHRSKELGLFATTIADQWKSMIVELSDRAAETKEKSKNLVPSFDLEEWREFPSVEYVPQPPVEFSEKKFLDDMDDCENAGKDNNETAEERRENDNAAKEKEAELKLQESMKREKAKKESVEKFINRRSNGPSNKSNIEVEKARATEKQPSMGNKRKLEEQRSEDAEFITPIRRHKVAPPKQESIPDQKPTKSASVRNPPKTGLPSDRDRKPVRVKKEVQNHGSETRIRYRALRINAEPRQGSPRARESRRSSDDNIAMEDRLETSKKKLQAGYQAHERAKRSIQLIPEGDLHKKAWSRSKNQTRK